MHVKMPWTKSWATKMNFFMSRITFSASVSVHRGAASGDLENAVEGCENHPKNWGILRQAGLQGLKWAGLYCQLLSRGAAVPGAFHNTFLDFQGCPSALGWQNSICPHVGIALFPRSGCFQGSGTSADEHLPAGSSCPA